MQQDENPSHVEVNGATLRHLRILAHRSAASLAREVGVTPTFMTMIERGARRRCNADVFAKVNAALGITDVRVLMARPHDRAAT